MSQLDAPQAVVLMKFKQLQLAETLENHFVFFDRFGLISEHTKEHSQDNTL